MHTSVSNQSDEKAWRTLAKLTRLKLNTAWWVEGFAPLLVGASLLGCGIVLYLRTQGTELPHAQTAAWVGGSLLALMLAAWLWARRKFFSEEECLVRLEGHMKLNNALTAASLGVAPWPAARPAEQVSDGFRWRWQWLALPILICVASLALAFLIPITPPDTPSTDIPLPSSASRVEEQLNELEKQEVTRKEDLAKFERALEELKNQPKEDWYSHANMEAADHLKETLAQSLADLQSNLDKAAAALNELAREDGQVSEAQKEKAVQEMQKALDGLKNGGLQPNKDLMKALQNLDVKDLSKSLSKQEMEQLQQKLKENAQKCKECQGKGKGDGEGEGEGMGSLEKSIRDQLKNGDQDQDGDQEQAPLGAGPPERGPGVAPLKLKDDASELNTNKPEASTAKDLERALPGDMLGTADGAFEVDPNLKATEQSGGGVAEKGKGGEAIWRENLLPSEKRVLKKFFQ